MADVWRRESCDSEDDAMSSRLARDDEVAAWERDGWVLLDGLVGTDEIDAATTDLWLAFPSRRSTTPIPTARRRSGSADHPSGTRRTSGPNSVPASDPSSTSSRASSRWPDPARSTGCACIPQSSTSWNARCRRPTSGAIRPRSSAKYTGETNYEQPMHTDRNHSWLPRAQKRRGGTRRRSSICDVDAGNASTHLVPLSESVGRATTAPLFMPKQDPELYAAERPAEGVRGSLLVYRPDVFHRGGRPHRARWLALPVERELQGRRSRLDRVPHRAVALVGTRVDGVRRGVDAA